MSTLIQEKNGDNQKLQLLKRTKNGRQSTQKMRTRKGENKVQGLPGGPRALGPQKQRLAQNEPEIDGEQPEWDKLIREHRDEIVQEYEKRTENVETETEREQSWELYRLCKNYLEENSEAWRTRKIQREHEKNRQERLEKAGLLRRKTQIEYIENNINKGIEKLTPADREKLKLEEQRKEKLEIENAKKDLWKFRGKEKKHKSENKINKIQELGEKAELIATLLEQERERTKIEKKLIEQTEAAKKTREQKRKEKIEQERKIEEHWAMYRWTTEYIEKNMKYWEYKRKIREQERQKKLDEWDKKNRLEKIQTLKRKYVERKTIEGNEPENNEKYDKWREQKQQEEESTTSAESESNREQNTAPDLPVFPIFKKLKEATKIKIPVNQEHGLVFGGPDMGVAKTNATKTTPSKPSIKKPTEKTKSNKINKQNEGNTETNPDKNKKKTK